MVVYNRKVIDMGFSVTRFNFTFNNNVNLKGSTPDIEYSQCLFLNIIEDFIHNGFSLYDSEVVDQNGNTSRPPTVTDVTTSSPITTLQLGTIAVILIPDETVDPYISTNPWFLKISVLDGYNTASPYYYSGMQIGVNSYYPDIEMPRIGSNAEKNIPMNKILPTYSGSSNSTIVRMYPSNPYGYTLTIVKRGFSLNVFSQVTSDDLQYSGFFVVQRAMGCNGAINSTGNLPLYLLTNVTPVPLNSGSSIDSVLGPQASWFARIVRENYLTTQTPDWVADSPTFMSTSIGNNGADYELMRTNISDTRELLGNVLHRFPDRWQGPVTRDTGEYVLLFPFGICSERYAYTDEIDLIAVSKANAYQASQQVPVSVYTETRTYLAGSSNNNQVGNNSGIRVFIYIAGPEITAPTSYNDVNIQATDTVTTSWGNVQANTGS